jgi:hypothetical protein
VTDPKELRALLAKTTGGPWIAASRPSSIVGWPVVGSPMGRMVCSISYAAHIAPDIDQADIDAHYAECEANAAFIAASRTAVPALLDRVEELEKALTGARDVLRMMTAPDAIQQTTVINAYAQAVEAERIATRVLTPSDRSAT